MKKLISAAALAIGISTGAFAQTAGPTQVFIASPTGTTVANFYKSRSGKLRFTLNDMAVSGVGA